jgi:hypothetical protein
MRLTSMRIFAFRLLSLALVGSPMTVRAQFRTMPDPSGYQPPSQTQVVSMPVQQLAPSFSPYAPPWWNFQTPMGSYLSGASDVINSQANFMISKQQANLIQQQAEQARVDTRRKQYEQWQWERSQAPTLEDVRQEAYMENLRRARNNPPDTEIWSGAALNTLLGTIQRTSAANGIQGPTVPIDESIVKQINVTTGATNTTSGSIGMLRGGKLDWPAALRAETFSAHRGQIDQSVADAVNQIMASGQANADTVSSLTRAVTGLRSDLRAQIAEISTADYVRALRYINGLRDATGQLTSPSAANYLSGRFQPRASTVGELVDQMTQNGVRFAPATPGNENAYSALYQSLIAYDAGLGRLVRR